MIFLGSELSAEESRPSAYFHILPVPLERTVSYGAGTRQGPQAIIDASHELERVVAGCEPCQRGLFTEAPAACEGELADIMEAIAGRTEAIAQKGNFPVVLGGEHSLTYGAVMGLVRAWRKPVGIVQVDAHADLRVAYQGEKHSHASVMHLLTDEGLRLAQFGVRALSQEEQESRERKNVFYLDAEELVVSNRYECVLPDDFPELIYVSFDVDGLDPSLMPATGTPVPGGLGYYQALHLVQSALKGRRLIGFDVVELAPDPKQNAWSFTAAQIVYRLMALASG